MLAYHHAPIDPPVHFLPHGCSQVLCHFVVAILLCQISRSVPLNVSERWVSIVFKEHLHNPGDCMGVMEEA